MKKVCQMAVLLLAVAVLHIGVAAAQLGGCQCDGPPCLEAPQRTPTGSECIKVPRPDCPCCLVCGHQEGEQCDDLSQPCDLSSRLFCNTTSGLCQKGKTRLFWILIAAFFRLVSLSSSPYRYHLSSNNLFMSFGTIFLDVILGWYNDILG